MLITNYFGRRIFMSILLNYYHIFTCKTRYFDGSNKHTKENLCQALKHLIAVKRKKNQPILLLCIGTDRATGDCLGPLIGYKLKNMEPDIKVLGNLNTPVHAKNLDEAVCSIESNTDEPFVIAIDACLGAPEHIGYVTLSPLGVKPGEGVQKDLPVVGDISITGIVNECTSSNSMTLQSTRLNVVMNLADTIADSIAEALCLIKSDCF